MLQESTDWEVKRFTWQELWPAYAGDHSDVPAEPCEVCHRAIIDHEWVEMHFTGDIIDCSIMWDFKQHGQLL